MIDRYSFAYGVMFLSPDGEFMKFAAHHADVGRIGKERDALRIRAEAAEQEVARLRATSKAGSPSGEADGVPDAPAPGMVGQTADLQLLRDAIQAWVPGERRADLLAAISRMSGGARQ